MLTFKIIEKLSFIISRADITTRQSADLSKERIRMDKNKTSWLLFLATILSPIVAFALVCLVGEVEIFSIAGIVRYSWIMWLFTPICILTIIIGYCWKKHKFKYKLNIISAFICFALLSSSFIKYLTTT